MIVRKHPDGARFEVAGTGEIFMPRGFNYVRLRGGDHATFDAETATTAAAYNTDACDAMLADLQSHGYNVVRVFIIGRNTSNPGIAGNPAQTIGVYEPYMLNVIDFLDRARAHGIYVFPTFGDGELPISAHYQQMLRGTPGGSNAVYFCAQGIAARAQYLADFLQFIAQRRSDLLPTLLAVQCQNELSVASTDWPFNITTGTLPMSNGRTYDMADAHQRRALMNEGLQYYHANIVNAVKAIDPQLLVAEGIFTNMAVGKSLEEHLGIWPGDRDNRYPADLVSLGNAPLDFLDIHYYRTSRTDDINASFKANMHSSRYDDPEMMEIRKAKPVILGEFGAFRFVESDINEVIPNMVRIRDAALDAGLAGYLYWTYDCLEQAELYYAKEGSGEMVERLSIRST